jgi:hypothetical protein
VFFGNWLILGNVFALIQCSLPNVLKVFGLAIFLFCVVIFVLFPGGRLAILGVVLTFPIPILLLLLALLYVPPALDWFVCCAIATGL